MSTEFTKEEEDKEWAVLAATFVTTRLFMDFGLYHLWFRRERPKVCRLDITGLLCQITFLPK